MYFDIDALMNELYSDDDIGRESIESIVSKKGKMLYPEDDTQKISFLINSIFLEVNSKEYLQQRMVKHLLLGLMIEIIRSVSNNCIQHKIHMKNDILPAINFIKDNFNSFIKISELAKSCCMSESHFRRVFENYMNMKPLDYINYVRIQKSCALLRNTDYPVVMIAEKVGYVSPSSYIRNFKRITGKTPYQWKMNEKKENYEHYKDNVTVLKGWLE